MLSPSTQLKRKANTKDFHEAKRPCNMFSMKQEFNNLLSKKKEYLIRQRRCSLLIDPLKTEDNPLIPEFSKFYRRLSNAPMAAEDHTAQLALIEQVIQESIIIEWPKVVDGISSTDERVEIDMAPLIHRARNVVKCRTSHPTMRVKVCAITQDVDDAILPQPKTVEAFFRASLVKLLHDGATPRQAAGRMILTQREGTPAAKNLDQNGATVSNGKLIASQVASNNVSRVLVERMDERDAKTTPFKYDNRVLCATFPEMGVALNSMVDRRQLATRYAIQVEVAINIDNKLIVNHVVLSHPFLIAITNDQTEPLLYSIFWSRMLASEHNDSSEMYSENSTIPWSILRQAIQNYVKAQVVQARSLQYHEVCHIQCMILLPRVIRCKTVEELNSLELELYGNVKASSTTNRVKEIRDRLLTEQVLPTCLIERRELMVDKCISCLDMSTELQHTVWSWLFKGTEMLQDVGHKLCPSPIMGEKKGSKTKKQMAACEEYQTMLSLFNKGLITFASSLSLQRIFRDNSVMGNEAILIRICDENCGFLSFVFGFENSSTRLRMGSLSAEHVKDLKQGLPEVLIDEPFPSKFEYLIKIDAVDHQKYEMTISLLRKRAIFNNYETMRLDPSVHVHDDESVRINPLTGAKVTRTSPPTNDLVQPSPFLVPQPAFVNLPPVSNALLSLLQQQLTLPTAMFNTGMTTGFDIRTLLRTIKLPQAAEDSESEGDDESDDYGQNIDMSKENGVKEEKSSDETH
uniref:NARG2_C domain-containing protein n=1 Tax=Haemonchus contortus TaxID=6289 RepID=A0A7I4Y824_HAECO|nr:Protein C44F1.1 [Haemonchus contortus]